MEANKPDSVPHHSVPRGGAAGESIFQKRVMGTGLPSVLVDILVDSQVP
jgi:hypothetical protein